MRTLGVLLLIATGALGQYQALPVYYSYNDGCKESVRSGKPMVVFVGHVPRVGIGGAVLTTVNTLGNEYPQQCVVVSIPQGGDVLWKATLPITISDVELAKEVSRAAVPFRPVLAVQQPRAANYCPT